MLTLHHTIIKRSAPFANPVRKAFPGYSPIHNKAKRFDKLLSFIGMPVLSIILPALGGMDLFSSFGYLNQLVSLFIFTGIGLLIYRSNFVIFLAYKRHSGKDSSSAYAIQIARCIGIISISTFTLCVLAIATWNTVIVNQSAFHPSAWRTSLIVTLAAIVITLVYELLYLSQQAVSNTNAITKLEASQRHIKLNALTLEMDPHFIYNSLSGLCFTLKKDVDSAEQYVLDLADLYQYVLDNRSSTMVTVASELAFATRFIALQRRRFGSSINFETEILSEIKDTMMIPPFTIQPVVENAIKHNRFSCNHPLQIKIILKGEYITVINNRIRNTSPTYSHGIGLMNIKERYLQLKGEQPFISECQQWYKISLPILTQKTFEGFPED